MSFSSNLAVVISFCSNDYPYLRHCIDSIKPFSSQIIISVCDHFFDGQREDRLLLNGIYAENLDVQFIEFAFNRLYSSVYWHNLSRLLGYHFIHPSITHVLFLDCDEIADTENFLKWLSSAPFDQYDIFRLSTYWYFRESFLQATTWEEAPLLIKKRLLNAKLLMHEQERAGIFSAIIGNKKRDVVGLDEKPFFHHYSWVRTKEQLLRKVQSWGHHWERDWASAVEEEFSREFNGTDFVHGYRFKKVYPHVEIDLKKLPLAAAETDFSHVRRLTYQEVSTIGTALAYQIPLPIKMGRYPRSLDI